MNKKDTFMLVSLQEKESRHLATVLANPTARKILDYLAKHSKATESSLSSKLDIPLSTVHYNLKQMIKGGLVEAEEYHYSQKGREVSHYSLANRYIIIAPTPVWDIKEKLKHILPMTVIAGGVAWLLQQMQRPFYVIQDIIPQAAQESIQESVRAVPAKVVEESTKDMAQSIAYDVAHPLAQEAVQAAPQEVIRETVKTVTQPAPNIVQQAVTPHIGWYFFAGFLLAVMLYLIYDYYKSKK